MLKSNQFIHSGEAIKDALRRNRMQGKRRISLPANDILSPKDDYSKFLEFYVFEKLGVTPNELYRTLHSQYYAEQNFRDRRTRNIDFTRGRHFNERVYDAEAKTWMTQWEYLQRRNIPPLTYNVISKLVRSLTGQFREINTGNIVKCESKDARGQELAYKLTECLNRAKRKNRAVEQDAKNMKEMLHSGRPVFKAKWGSDRNMGKKDIRYRLVNTAKFGINPGVTDHDMDNLHTAYELHDTDINSIVEMFAKGDYERGQQIKLEYLKYQGNELQQSSYSNQSFNGQELRNLTFDHSGVTNSSYRYIEVWTKVSDWEAMTVDPLGVAGDDTKIHKWTNPDKVIKQVKEANDLRIENAKQAGMDYDEQDLLIQYSVEFRTRWYVSFITPWGFLLDVKESPYKNGRLPYVFPSPDINGELWGLIEEVTNAQLSLDRQILQADAIISNASKGVWLVPDIAVPDDLTPKEYLAQLKKTDGAVIVKTSDQHDISELIPQQKYANASNVGNQVQGLIQLYSNLVDEISGNYAAAQGKGSAGAGKTATGYALESQNAGLNIRDTFDTYFDVLVQRDGLLLDMMIEGYTKSDYTKITGVEIDPNEIKKYEFVIEQSKGTNSPAHRLALEQELLNVVQAGLMPFEVFMEVSNNPIMQQAKQKMEELQREQATAQQAQLEAEATGGTAINQEALAPNDIKQVQGHPQAKQLTDSPIAQALPKLPGLPQTNIL